MVHLRNCAFLLAAGAIFFAKSGPASNCVHALAHQRNSLSRLDFAAPVDQVIEKIESLAPKNHKNYIDNRSLFEASPTTRLEGRTTSYQASLPPNFIADLLSLEPDQTVVDGGAGTFDAWLDYYSSPLGPTDPAQVIAIVDALSTPHQLKNLLPNPRFTPLIGQKVEDVATIQNGSTDLVVDVYGAFSYSEHPDLVLRQYLKWLKPGGRIYIAYQPFIATNRPWAFHLREVEQKPTGWLSAFLSRRREPPKPQPPTGLVTWLAMGRGYEFEMSGPGMRHLMVRRNSTELFVQPLRLYDIEIQNPPRRVFELAKP